MPWENGIDNGFRGGFGQVSPIVQQQQLSYSRPSACESSRFRQSNLVQQNGFQHDQRASPDSGLCTPDSESQYSFNSERDQQLSPIGGATAWTNPGDILSSRSQSLDAQSTLPLPLLQEKKFSAPGPVTAMAALECSCNRPKALVACQRCGFETNGRVQKTCERHPNRNALMDLVACPKCRSKSSLKELRA